MTTIFAWIVLFILAGIFIGVWLILEEIKTHLLNATMCLLSIQSYCVQKKRLDK